jgi:hypothetical protein
MTDVTFLLRRGSAIEWLADPVLKQGEPGFDVTTEVLKIGDGISPWSVLRSHIPALKPNRAIALGAGAGNDSQQDFAVAIGNDAGNTSQQNSAVAIGLKAGFTDQGADSIAIGSGAGYISQQQYSIALGNIAGQTNQGSDSVAIGSNAGNENQGTQSVALGVSAGSTGQGESSVAIGYQAGFTTQAANTIILNASGVAVNGVSGQTGSFYVSPVRNADSSYVMNYNPTTYEVSYSQKLGSSSGIDAYTLVEQGLTNNLSATIVGSGSVTFDISELLPTIRTFPLFTYPSDVGYTVPGGNAFQFNAYWFTNSNDASVMTSGYLRFTLISGDTSVGTANRTIYDIADLNKKAIAFNDKLTNTYEIKLQYIVSETDDTILQLVMDWVDIDVSTKITIKGVILVPFAYQPIVPTK